MASVFICVSALVCAARCNPLGGLTPCMQNPYLGGFGHGLGFGLGGLVPFEPCMGYGLDGLNSVDGIGGTTSVCESVPNMPQTMGYGLSGYGIGGYAGLNNIGRMGGIGLGGLGGLGGSTTVCESVPNLPIAGIYGLGGYGGLSGMGGIGLSGLAGIGLGALAGTAAGCQPHF